MWGRLKAKLRFMDMLPSSLKEFNPSFSYSLSALFTCNLVLTKNNLFYKILLKSILYLFKVFFFLLKFVTFSIYSLNKEDQIALLSFKGILDSLNSPCCNFIKAKGVKLGQLKKMIVFKIKRLELELVIYQASGKKTAVYFKNIIKIFNLRFKGRIPRESRIWWLGRLPFFKDFLNIVYFSTYFHTSKVLAFYIARNITNRKKHFYLLKRLRVILNYFFQFEPSCDFRGLRITVRGKFQGILRKRRFRIKFGHPGIQELGLFMDYNLQRSFTKFGVFSIKVWLIYEHKDTKELMPTYADDSGDDDYSDDYFDYPDYPDYPDECAKGFSG